jgi:hypothetical protein
VSRRVRVGVAELALVAVLVAGGFVAASGRHTNGTALATGLAVGAAAESTGLYCTGFTGVAGAVPGSILFTSTTDQSRRVLATLTSTKGAPRDVSFTLAPWGQHTLAASLFAGAAYYGVSAQVGGSGVVASVVGTGDDRSIVPCASGGVTSWTAAGLSTHVGTNTVLTLLNPTATEAVVDVTAVTPTGVVAPQSFEMVVAPNALSAVTLGTQIVDESDVAAQVRVRQGSVVAAAAMDWTTSPPGSAIVAGGDGANRDMWFPSVATNEAFSAELLMANPSSYPVTVTVRVKLGQFQIEPFVVTIAAASTRDLVLSPSGRVPAAGQAAVRVSASRPILATLEMRSSLAAGAWFVSPSPRRSVQALVDPSGDPATISVSNGSARAITVTLSFVQSAGGTRDLSVVVPANSSRALAASAETTVGWSPVALARGDGSFSLAGELAGAPGGVRVVAGSD